jgi:hypothetical protein
MIGNWLKNSATINSTMLAVSEEQEIEIQVQEEQIQNKEFDAEELNSIREKIELMSKFNQIEVLRILSKCSNTTLNENKYGIHVNLSGITDEVIEKLKIYINYVSTQESTLSFLELQKEEFKNIYFTKDNKDNVSKFTI